METEAEEEHTGSTEDPPRPHFHVAETIMYQGQEYLITKVIKKRVFGKLLPPEAWTAVIKRHRRKTGVSRGEGITITFTALEAALAKADAEKLGIGDDVGVRGAARGGIQEALASDAERAMVRKSRSEFAVSEALKAIRPFLRNMSLFKDRAKFKELSDHAHVVNSETFARAVQEYVSDVATEYNVFAMKAYAMLAFAKACDAAGLVKFKGAADSIFRQYCGTLWKMAKVKLSLAFLGEPIIQKDIWINRYISTFQATGGPTGELGAQAREFTAFLVLQLAPPVSPGKDNPLQGLIVSGAPVRDVDSKVSAEATMQEKHQMAMQLGARYTMAQYLADHSDALALLSQKKGEISNDMYLVNAKRGTLMQYFNALVKFDKGDNAKDCEIRRDKVVLKAIRDGISTVPRLTRADGATAEERKHKRDASLQIWNDKWVEQIKKEVLAHPPTFPSETTESDSDPLVQMVQIHATTNFVLDKLRTKMADGGVKISAAHINDYHAGALKVLEKLLRQVCSDKAVSGGMTVRFTRWSNGLVAAKKLAGTEQLGTSKARATLQLYDIIVRAGDCKHMIDTNLMKVWTQRRDRIGRVVPSQVDAFEKEISENESKRGYLSSLEKDFMQKVGWLVKAVKAGQLDTIRKHKAALTALAKQLVMSKPLPESTDEAIAAVHKYEETQRRYKGVLDANIKILRAKAPTSAKEYNDKYLSIAELQSNEELLAQARTHLDHWRILDARDGKGDFRYLLGEAKAARDAVAKVLKKYVDLRKEQADPVTEDIKIDEMEIEVLTHLEDRLKEALRAPHDWELKEAARRAQYNEKTEGDEEAEMGDSPVQAASLRQKAAAPSTPQGPSTPIGGAGRASVFGSPTRTSGLPKDMTELGRLPNTKRGLSPTDKKTGLSPDEKRERKEKEEEQNRLQQTRGEVVVVTDSSDEDNMLLRPYQDMHLIF